MTDERNPDPSKMGLPWLRGRLIGLFERAAGSGDPDHAVCVKYADLLYKIISANPTAAVDTKDDDLEAVRRSVLGIDEDES